MSPGATLPPAASASATVIDIARYCGGPAGIVPSGARAADGMTVNGAPDAPASLVGRIGSPTVIPVMVMRPTASSGLCRADGGAASVVILTLLRAAAGFLGFRGVSLGG